MVEYGRIKKNIFKYLNEHPKTTRKGLIREFPGYNESTVANYRLEWIGKNKNAKILKDGVKTLLNIMKTKMTPRRELNKKEREMIPKLEELINE